ncbi:MAG: PorT family protein [Lewinellaceae bacterium]|nr:PorT family protein [Lewinellaceae bacterium]
MGRQHHQGFRTHPIRLQRFCFSRYNLNDRLSLQLGLGYSNTGTRYPKTKAEWPQPGPDLATHSSLNTVQHSIIAPLQVHYRIATQGLRWYASAGLTPSYLASEQNNVKLWFSDGSTDNTNMASNLDNYNRVNLSAGLGFGVEIPLGSAMRLSVQPTFEANLLNVRSDDVPLNRKLYSLGLQTGIAF